MSDIIVKKITDIDLLREAAGMTTGMKSTMTLERAYINEHSPCRTQMFWIKMLGIPTSSSVHLVRHKEWVEHFVETNRPDRGGNREANRNTPVCHAMFINAPELIYMARTRLCNKASTETRAIMEDIKIETRKVDPDLVKMMVPNCVYRNGLCKELPTCGYKANIMNYYNYYPLLFR